MKQKHDRIDKILERLSSIDTKLAVLEVNLQNLGTTKEKVSALETKLTRITYLIIAGAGALSVYHWSTVKELLRFVL